MWVIQLIVIIAVSTAWSLKPGTNQSSSTTFNPLPHPASYTSKEINIAVSRQETINIGSDGILQCTNKTWNEMMYVIWTINVGREDCRIAFSNDGDRKNNCTSRTALFNTSRGESYLNISSFSDQDQGLYKCETVYVGGADTVHINVTATVCPVVSAWLERLEEDGSQLVAVCSAEKGNPAATITWKNAGNFSSKAKVTTQQNQDGSYTVTSRLPVPQGVDTGNLTCAIGHSYWKVEQRVWITAAAQSPLKPVLISAAVVGAILVFVGVLYFTQKNLSLIRSCLQPKATFPAKIKSPPVEEVEEVEPYASYVQRVNSIYNSSAELFT